MAALVVDAAVAATGSSSAREAVSATTSLVSGTGCMRMACGWHAGGMCAPPLAPPVVFPQRVAVRRAVMEHNIHDHGQAQLCREDESLRQDRKHMLGKGCPSCWQSRAPWATSTRRRKSSGVPYNEWTLRYCRGL